MTEMGDRLREARIAAGYATGTDAARAFGWTVSTYLSHENSSRQISRRAALKYGRAFNVKPGHLLYSETESRLSDIPTGMVDPAAMTIVIRLLLEALEFPPEIAGKLAQPLTETARALSGLSEGQLTLDRPRDLIATLVSAFGATRRK